MAREWVLVLGDLHASVSDAISYSKDLSDTDLHELPEKDRLLYRALKNAVSEMGEAIKSVPQDVKDRHPEIDWRGLAGLRDIITHQYFGLDMEFLAPVLHRELPDLLLVVESEDALLIGTGTKP